jgi:hypothetical protein
VESAANVEFSERQRDLQGEQSHPLPLPRDGAMYSSSCLCFHPIATRQSSVLAIPNSLAAVSRTICGCNSVCSKILRGILTRKHESTGSFVPDRRSMWSTPAGFGRGLGIPFS